MRNLKNTKRGTVLVACLILLSICAFITVGMMRYVMASTRIEQRRNDGVIAFYMAEAGVHHLINFFNNPQQYSSDPNLFKFNESAGSFQNIQQAMNTTGKWTMPQNMLPNFKFKNNNNLGKVMEVTLYAPSAGDPPGTFAKIKSVGRTYSGVEKTVMLAAAPGILGAKCPAAIVSKNSTSYFNGNASVRWGEVWVKSTAVIKGYNQWGYYFDLSDPMWTIMRTESDIKYGTGEYVDGSKKGSAVPLTPSAGTKYYNPCIKPAQLMEYSGRLLMHQTLQFPNYDYTSFKTFSMQRGTYYGTDASGNIYKDAIKDDAHRVASFYDEFNEPDPVNGEIKFVFIDTIDGTAPKADGSNLANLQVSGSGPHTKGIFYIAGNIKYSGLGNPPTVVVKDPNNQNYSISKLFHNGLIYIAGSLDVTGNMNVYGSMIVEREISGTGTPMVYYNVKLKDNSYFPINSSIQVRLFKVE